MGAENQHGAVRDFFNGFHENGAAAAKLLDDVSVVNNFMVHIDRRAISFQSQFDDIHGADHAGAKAARPHAEQYLSIAIVLVLHCHPSLLQPRELYHTSAARPRARRFVNFDFAFDFTLIFALISQGERYASPTRNFRQKEKKRG